MPSRTSARKAAAAPQDPLALMARRRKEGARGRPFRFASGEHVFLGDAGAAEACRTLRQQGVAIADAHFEAVRRRHGEERFSYGELVALSGDFYRSPEELFEEKPAPLPWLWEDNDLSDLRKMFDEELKWIEARQSGRGAPVYPDFNVRMAWNAKAYVELALDNVDHFGWHNMVAYCRHHQRALELAASAAGRNDERWAQALVTNAFADHFLTDAFAAGHVRVPRAEIRAWARAQGLSDKLAGALSKLLHDQDGHVRSVHATDEGALAADEGLPVRNARG
ncbi:MAG: hypothetical protein ACK4N5_05305, partial [Myxococcales bacterium]